MAAILDAAEAQRWPCTFGLVLSNKGAAGGLVTARDRGIPTAFVDHRPFGRARRAEYDAELVRVLRHHRIDWVVLAGFMRILSPVFTDAFAGRILNIHPSLLPLYPGLHTHQRALDAGDLEHGCTVHLVDASLDGGPILAQARVPILTGDTPDILASRVLVEEHRLYPAVVRAAVRGELARAFPASSEPQSAGSVR